MLAALAAAALAAEPPSVVLVSMDTTRADALSCYGTPPGGAHGRAVTPTLDLLAAEGARFERFYAHAPTTLSSHASMLTGLDPHGHGVPRNGYPLDPDLPTLATRLSAAGWDTIAVVGAAPLAPEMGLDRGFRVYDATFPEVLGPQLQDRAAGVVDRALATVGARDRARPLFLFVHFYDPHAPYQAPAPWDRAFADPGYQGPYLDPAAPLRVLQVALAHGRAAPADLAQVTARYLGEVAYVDHELGRLLDGLRAAGVLDRAVVAVTADHGEILHELPELAWSHGADVGDGSLRVPLVVRAHGLPLAERAVIRSQAPMSGLAPTLEELAGLAPTLGRGFADLLRPGPARDEDGWPDRPTRVVLQEATRPEEAERTDAWNNLDLDRAVRAGGFLARAAPAFGQALALEGAGPGDEPALPLLRALLAAWDAAAPSFRPALLGEEERAALEALGYQTP